MSKNGRREVGRVAPWEAAEEERTTCRTRRVAGLCMCMTKRSWTRDQVMVNMARAARLNASLSLVP